MKFGTAYYPDYFPATDWPVDLDRMKAAGITTIRILEFGWSWYQPEPDRWEWDGLDRFLDLAWQRQLRVCLATSTATPPPWFFERYPDAYLLDEHGNRCLLARHMTCWNHPQAWAEAANTIRTLAGRYGSHPAVWGWQIDNEPCYAEDNKTVYDFNPHAIRAAQEWLKTQYGTLDRLNEAWFGAFWSQRYTRWEQIWRTHGPKTNPNAFLAFCRWRESNVGAFVQDQAALLREHTRGQKIGVNMPESSVCFSLAVAQDYWAQARGLDWIGTDLYYANGHREKDLADLRYSCDVIRSVVESVAAPGAEFVHAETPGGPHLRTWQCTFSGETWGPDFLDQTFHIQAERGATQSWLFMWRPTRGGKEIGMNGLQTFEGEDTPRTEVVRHLAGDTSSLDEVARAYGERPVALVHYSQDSLRHLLYFEPMDRANEILHGIHRLLDTEGFCIRFVTDAEIQGGLPDAARLVLPLSPLLPPAAQQAVIDWQQGAPGRQLWLGPDTGLIDGDGNWLRREDRPLWTWLDVEPGPLCDLAEKLEIDGEVVDRFRVLEAGPSAHVLSTAPWRGRKIPVRIECRPGVFLHACDWRR
jgi:beta-galactosidase